MLTLCLLAACGSADNDRDILPEVPEGAQAVSLTGRALFPADPPQAFLDRYRDAREDWEADPGNPDKLIWHGRWAAYCGEYREAIRIFSRGVADFPDDPRMLRHRGHRYITVREFERAVKDFERAAEMIAGLPDEVEPDGMPNPMGIPVSTLHSNIYYHLGLARYLLGNLEGALSAWQSDMALEVNDDMTVATLHWIYMALRELGRDGEAASALEVVTDDMHVIENTAYQQLCLFYKGQLTLSELTGEEKPGALMEEPGASMEEPGAPMNDAMLYGIGNWFRYNGDPETARVYFSRIFEGGSWASFGYVAAEAKTASD